MQQPEPQQELGAEDVPVEQGMGNKEIKDMATTTELPENAHTNSDGVPTYLGVSGTKLINLITATSTIGFLLFGYVYAFCIFDGIELIRALVCTQLRSRCYGR